MENGIQWRNVARAYYEKYVATAAEQDMGVDGFDTLDEWEVNAIIEGLKYAVHLVVTASMV